jgi:predicted Zn-ribbon and HTH transcriptional regulator
VKRGRLIDLLITHALASYSAYAIIWLAELACGSSPISETIIMLAAPATVPLLVSTLMRWPDQLLPQTLIIIGATYAMIFYIVYRDLRRRRLNRYRLAHSICLQCGNDLRATPDRCRECGAKPPQGETNLNWPTLHLGKISDLRTPFTCISIGGMFSLLFVIGVIAVISDPSSIKRGIPSFLLLTGGAATFFFWQAKLAQRRQRLKARHGYCQECGYDLRGTPDRCPECGKVVEKGPPQGPKL